MSNKIINDKKQSRVLVNLLGIPLLLSAIIFGGIYFQCLIFIAIIMCTLELNKMCLKKDIEIQMLSIFLFYLYLFLTHFIEPLNMEVLILATIFILSFEVFRKKNNPIENIALTVLSMVWIGVFLNCLVVIRNFSGGDGLTLIMFLSVWICDSAAFIFGSKFGKTKILPKISPNKTWLGTIFGIVSVFILLIVMVGFPFYSSIKFDVDSRLLLVHIICLSLIFAGIGQIGDFVESMIKRQFGVKDSGTSLRGHGGFLDRMDSLMLAAPSFYLYLKYVI